LSLSFSSLVMFSFLLRLTSFNSSPLSSIPFSSLVHLVFLSCSLVIWCFNCFPILLSLVVLLFSFRTQSFIQPFISLSFLGIGFRTSYVCWSTVSLNIIPLTFSTVLPALFYWFCISYNLSNQFSFIFG
jgi:hypothetical protein